MRTGPASLRQISPNNRAIPVLDKGTAMELYQRFRRALGIAPKIHPVDRGLARHWTKQKLTAVFPELRGNRHGLEAAYRALDLEPRASETNPTELVFEVGLHREIEP
jgi:hypothetical protein